MGGNPLQDREKANILLAWEIRSKTKTDLHAFVPGITPAGQSAPWITPTVQLCAGKV